jgi:hypothetical protein
MVSLRMVMAVMAVADRRQRRPEVVVGEVVAGAFDGSGSVAAFDGGHGLQAKQWQEGDDIQLWRWQLAAAIDGGI